MHSPRSGSLHCPTACVVSRNHGNRRIEGLDLGIASAGRVCPRGSRTSSEVAPLCPLPVCHVTMFQFLCCVAAPEVQGDAGRQVPQGPGISSMPRPPVAQQSPLAVPILPCACVAPVPFRFRPCPLGFRCGEPVFHPRCQVVCAAQLRTNQAACEVSRDHVNRSRELEARCSAPVGCVCSKGSLSHVTQQFPWLCNVEQPSSASYKAGSTVVSAIPSAHSRPDCCDANAIVELRTLGFAACHAPCKPATTEAMHEFDHNHLHGCRIGEASHPGPGVTSQLSFLGPEFAKQIQAQIEAAVQAAVMQALSQLNIPGLAAGALSATRPHSHGDAQKPEGGPGPKKRKRKRKGKAKDAAEAANAEAEAPQPARRVVVAGDDTNKGQGHRPDAGGRGKGKGGPKPNKAPAEPADDGWKLVRPKSCRDQDGEFTLRAEDWSAPIVEFSKLATFLDDAMAGTTLEAVVYIKPEQKEVAANLIRGAGSPYKFLLIYLDKKEGCRTPGMIDGKLVFRQAVVTRISSDQNLSGFPQPKGITADAVKIQPATETAVLFMKVYKNYMPPLISGSALGPTPTGR